VRVTRQIVGFKKIKFYTNENVGAGNLSMPEQEMHTTAFWLHFPAEFMARFPDLTPDEKRSGLAGLGNALRTVAALLLMCDPRDLGVAFGEQPNLYLYDCYPGGVGLSAPLHRMADRLVQLTSELLAACECEAGCPSCVGAPGEVGERGKEAAMRVARERSALLSHARESHRANPCTRSTASICDENDDRRSPINHGPTLSSGLALRKTKLSGIGAEEDRSVCMDSSSLAISACLGTSKRWPVRMPKRRTVSSRRELSPR
jgi:ATP-dependent helicase YprA (DUF1998 family)